GLDQVPHRQRYRAGQGRARRRRRRRLCRRRRRRTARTLVRRHHPSAHGLRMGFAAARVAQGRTRRRRSHDRGAQGGERMKNPEMLEALSALAVEKGISEEIMLESLANALFTAYKRMPDAAEEALVEIDVETG